MGLKSLFVALVMTFMGAVSVSAQNFYPNGQAAAIIATELGTLSGPTSKAVPPTSQTNGGMIVQSATIDASNLAPLKIAVLELIMVELKHGADTQTAIENVFSALPAVGDRATKLATVHAYVIDLLS